MSSHPAWEPSGDAVDIALDVWNGGWRGWRGVGDDVPASLRQMMRDALIAAHSADHQDPSQAGREG